MGCSQHSRTSKYNLRHSIALVLGVSAVGVSLWVPGTSTAADTSTVKIKKVVKTVPPEKAVATVSKTKVEHTSPTTNMLSILKNVPGFNVLSSGASNLVSSNTAFTLNGFTSTEVGTTFDGVPIVNTIRGGVYGAADDHALTPLTMGQIGSVQVYSGANTPQQNSLDSLGGTVNFTPKDPSNKFGVDLSVGLGKYATTGHSNSVGVTANSGALPSMDGFKVITSFHHTNTDSFQSNVYGKLNSFYLNAMQPFNSGLSKLSFILTHNDQTAQAPEMIPVALLEAYGRDYQYPRDVYNNYNQTKATHMILKLETYMNPHMEGGFKLFYNDSDNDRTGYANAAYNNTYLGYPLPMYVKSDAYLNGFGNNYSVYNSTLATQLFGSSENGTQYQRYIDHYYNVGGKGHFTFLLPYNTVTLGGMLFSAKNLTTTAWYGSSPVPVTVGYNTAWYERDGLDYVDGYLQDNMALMGGKLHIYPGAKYVQSHPQITDTQGYYYTYAGSIGSTYRFVEPSLGATYSPIKPVELYMNYGRTYKAPDESAFYSVIGSNPIPDPVLVQPEYVNSLDAGIRYSGAEGKASFSVFDRKFENIFSYYYDNFTGVTTEYNAGKADYKGFTLSLEKPITEHMAVLANYGYTNAKYTNSFTGTNGSVTSGMARPNVPKYTANLALDYHKGPWFGEVSSHFVGSQYIAYDTGVTSDTKLPSYETIDLKGTYTWKLHEPFLKKVKVSAYIENLLDKKYYSYAYINTKSTNFELAQVGAPRFMGVTVTGTF